MLQLQNYEIYYLKEEYIKKLVLEKNKIGKKDIIFKVVKKEKVYNIIRMDLVESLLIRDIKGIKLEEIEMEK